MRLLGILLVEDREGANGQPGLIAARPIAFIVLGCRLVCCGSHGYTASTILGLLFYRPKLVIVGLELCVSI